LQHLSLGEELMVATRQTKSTTVCPSGTEGGIDNFVVNCALREQAPFLKEVEYGNITLTIDKEVNNYLPPESLYATRNRGDFVFQSIPMRNTTVEEALEQWNKLYKNGYYTIGTDEVYLMFIVVAPDAPAPGTGGVLTLVMVHFIVSLMAFLVFIIAWASITVHRACNACILLVSLLRWATRRIPFRATSPPDFLCGLSITRLRATLRGRECSTHSS